MTTSSSRPSRRALLTGGLGVAAVGTLAACGADQSGAPVRAAATATSSPASGRSVITRTVTAKPVTLDLGGPIVQTWAYGDEAPGELVRATAGDLLRVTLDNQLPAETTIHWHGVATANEADGVPDLTQDPVAPGATFEYRFRVPDPGTYFFHPHVGVQLDRGLYAPLVVDDPGDPGDHDLEWVVVLDDWLDGTGRTPDDVLERLTAESGSSSSGMGGMDMGSGMGGMDMGSGMGGSGVFGDAGDIAHPYHLVNGRVASAPRTLTGKPGQRVRIRVVNAASDTVFAVALGGHRLDVTHTDGYPVRRQTTGAFYVGMGERYDVEATLEDGVFPLVAQPVGKAGLARALVRTGSGSAPPASVLPDELAGSVLLGSRLQPANRAKLAARSTDTGLRVVLNGQMSPYRWGINGAPFPDNDTLRVAAGDRVRVQVTNMTMMSHPLHLHGHTFAVAGSGLRKDTLMLRPMESQVLDFDADNPGRWAVHCHNTYHAMAGMMAELRYRD
jgi:FtsP/CotA-like multicopper oxidase with cupredoxin domain